MVLLLSTEEHSASRVFTKLGIYTKRAVSIEYSELPVKITNIKGYSYIVIA